MEKIALVLARINAAEKFDAVVRMPDAGLVARGDQIGSHGHGVVKKGSELDFRIAEHVGIGRAAGAVFPEETGKDAFLVLFGEIDGFDIDADDVRYAARIDEVLTGRAVFTVIVVLPVLHEEADDVVALLLEKPCADGGVHSARKSDDDGLFCHVCRGF